MGLNKKLALAAATGAVVASGSAFADVAAVTTAIGGAATDAGTIGGAVLLVVVAIFAFKMLRKAM